MVLFNYTSKELTAKIVYYGPGLCGKTSNLQFIYDNLPSHVKKGKMLSLATKTDRTLFFDFLPIDLGRIRGMKTRVQLYTVPGQVFYNSTRKLVLKGADGLVFVADSQQKMMESNTESYKNLEENLREIGLKLEEMPLVMQFNKRDLPNLASVEEMNTLINRHNAPFYEAVATTGIGVEDTLKAITKLVLNHLAAKYNLGVPADSRDETVDEIRGTARPAPQGREGIAVSPDTGDMEIEGAPQAADHRAPAAQAGSTARESSASNEVSFTEDADDGREEAGMAEDLEIVDLGETEAPEDLFGPEGGPAGSPGPEPVEDLSDLLEELPPEPGDESAPSPDQPFPDFRRPSPAASPAPGPAAPRAASAEPLRPVPEAPLPADPPGGPAASSSRSREGAISALDPLGLGIGRSLEAPLSSAIQVGAVTPGREHEITVPLEMSVEGRKVRLHLKMTLTLSR